MKQQIWYTLSPKASVVEFDAQIFQEQIHITWAEGFEFRQDFDRNEIVAYRTCILTDISEERLAEVEKLYDLVPTEIRTKNDWQRQYIFETVKPLSKTRMVRLAKNLSEIYFCEFQFYMAYEPQCAKIESSGKKIFDNVILGITDQKPIADSVNLDVEQYVNDTIDVAQVLYKLHKSYPFDPKLNIVVGYGKPFAFVARELGSIEVAYRFFNEHFDAWFKVTVDDISEYLQLGIPLKGASLIESDGWYWVEKSGKEGWLTMITDFTIRVHYQVQRANELVYIVTLVSRLGKEVPHIEWKNTVSETTMSDFILKHWPYHLSANKMHLKILHEMISNTKVPTIHTYQQYGLNEYKGGKIMILPDAVYDFENERFFPKHESLDFYFLGGNDGIAVDGWDVDLNNVPRFSRNEESGYDDYFAITDKLYEKNMKHIPLMIACGIAWAACYETGIKKPHYYITGTTGSGKSTMSDLIASMFGVKTVIDMYNTTLYPLRVVASSVKRLPLFFQEYRTSMPYAKEKDGIIRLVFDEGSFQRGTKSGTILKYQYQAQMCLEGEDTSNSGSIRSRCILITINKFHKNSALQWASKVISDAKIQLAWFFGSFARKTLHADYIMHLEDGLKLFNGKWAPHRIVSNLALMYAGCMAYAPDKKEIFIWILSDILAEQIHDFNTNGEWAMFLKIVGEYLSTRYAKVYIQQWYVYLEYNEIVQHILKTRKKMDLSIESYVGHLVEQGFESGFYEVEDKWEWQAHAEYRMIEWCRIPILDAPTRLLTHPKIYAAFQEAKKRK